MLYVKSLVVEWMLNNSTDEVDKGELYRLLGLKDWKDADLQQELDKLKEQLQSVLDKENHNSNRDNENITV